MIQRRIANLLGRVSHAVLGILAGALLLAGAGLAKAGDLPPLSVVATFSVVGDMVKEVGGSHVNVVTIVGPNADTHSFEPTPQAVQALGQAQVLVSNGLGFETWLPRLIAASGFSGVHIVASEGATLRAYSGAHAHTDADAHAHDAHERADGDGEAVHAEIDHAGAHGTADAAHQHRAGDIDPHAWQNLDNGMVYARNIADGLSKADPARAPRYQRRVKKYLATMEKLDAEIRNALSVIPVEHRKAVVAHDAFGYFGDAYEVTFIPLAALGDAAEPSAQDIARVIDRVRALDRVGVFPETISNPRLLEQLAREADVLVGGPLYSDALAASDDPAGSYLGMFHWNAGQLISTLRPDNPSPAVQ